MIDVKKIITGFLILATAAICSGLVLSFINFSPQPVAVAAPQIQTANALNSLNGASAFLPDEPSQDVTLDNTTISTDTATASDPNNLTQTLADSYANQAIAANPNGPTNQGTGNPTLTPPPANTVAQEVANSTSTQNLSVPDWDVEAGSQPINVINTTNAATVAQYATAAENIMNESFNDKLQNILSGDAASQNGLSGDDLAYAQSQIKSALSNAIALPTPSGLVSFQKSLIKFLVYEKNLTQLNSGYQNDPVKAYVLLQAESDKFTDVEADLEQQVDAVSKLAEALHIPSSIAATQQSPMAEMFNEALGIKTVHALLPVFDPVVWGGVLHQILHDLAHDLQVALKNALLQILKNTLVALIQKKVLTWIQGAGTPRFVTNWMNSMVNTYQAKALTFLNGKMQCDIYPGFLPAVRNRLSKDYKSTNSGSCGVNPFQSALGVNSLQQYLNNFQNGSWAAFDASLQPSGNLAQSLFFAAQATEDQANTALQATIGESTAGSGFKGDKVCGDKSDPYNGVHLACVDANGGVHQQAAGTSCGTNGMTTKLLPNAGVTCTDWSAPQTQTPAQATHDALASAMDATPKQVAAATDIVGILNAVTNSLISSLSNFAINAANNVVNSTLTATPPSGIVGGGTPPTGLAQPLACDPAAQTVALNTTVVGAGVANSNTPAPTTISATGGTPDASGNFPTYNWVSASDNLKMTGELFTDTFPLPGTYSVTLSDSANDTPQTCTVTVQ